jgi:hypothetical protein
LSRLRDHYGFWPEELHLTLDNTTGENKTQYMLRQTTQNKAI